jgi:3'-phosphoadenosine 5'-phosphosulfate sulfotransferase (PAPS reductase)/FAD synthetase
MNNLQKLAFEKHACSQSFLSKLSYSRELVDKFLNTTHKPYIAFSTGKDSTVCLHLVREQQPETTAVYNDHEFLLPEMEEMLKRTPYLRRVARTVKHSEVFTSYPEGRPTSLPNSIEWINGSIRKDWAHQEGFDGCVVGLRSDENSYRKKHISHFGDMFFVKKYGLINCYPVAHWNVMDIWSYIFANNVSYCSAYDKLNEHGITLNMQRIGPLLNERVESLGQVAVLKELWPEVFLQLADRYPAIYSFT